MQRELYRNMFEEFIKCFRPFKRAAMMPNAVEDGSSTNGPMNPQIY